jgi:hypothetical protein
MMKEILIVLLVIILGKSIVIFVSSTGENLSLNERKNLTKETELAVSKMIQERPELTLTLPE